MDLLESGDERERPAWRVVRLPTWAVALIAVLAVGIASSGITAVAQDRQAQAREAARLEVDVRSAGLTSTTVGGVSRGELLLLLVNRREARVRLGALQLAVEGLRVTSVQPVFGKPLGSFEERLFTIGFEVPDCARLVLPGRLTVSLAADGQPVERRALAVVAPDASGDYALGACPPSARGTGTAGDVGVRPAGGSAVSSGAGAQGSLRLEVRNAGAPLQLVSYTGEVPGVTFTERRIDGGRSIGTDGLVVVRLAFRIEDCGELGRAGRLLLIVLRAGARLELQQPVGDEAGVSLPVLFDACG